ncbi:hypothetical protein OH77DRAFT_1083490 [Trametes cingulata]|nr:hypothetical protein OH77DRAFT_1083490 [Trametes cingulata]
MSARLPVDFHDHRLITGSASESCSAKAIVPESPLQISESTRDRLQRRLEIRRTVAVAGALTLLFIRTHMQKKEVEHNVLSRDHGRSAVGAAFKGPCTGYAVHPGLFCAQLKGRSSSLTKRGFRSMLKVVASVRPAGVQMRSRRCGRPSVCCPPFTAAKRSIPYIVFQRTLAPPTNTSQT